MLIIFLDTQLSPLPTVSGLRASSHFKKYEFYTIIPPEQNPRRNALYSRIDDLVPNDVFILSTIVLGALVVSTMCVTRNYYYVEKERDKKYYPLMSPLPNSGDFDICEI